MQHLAVVILAVTIVAKKNAVGGKSSKTKTVAHIATIAVTAVTREYP